MLAVSSNENSWVYSSIFRRLKQAGINPMIILADGATAITNAINDIYPAAKRSMCFAHVYRNAEKYFKTFNQEMKEVIKSDLHVLQLCNDETEFRIGKSSP